MNRLIVTVLVFMSLGLAGCSSERADGAKGRAVDPVAGAIAASGPSSSAGSPSKKLSQPFYVYRDKNTKNRFTPSGYMPNGDCISLDDAWQNAPHEGQSSIRIVYDVACSKAGRKWAGVYWQNPPDNWGSRKGGYDLTGATSLVFWAKGEFGGEKIEEFRAGGIGAGQLYPDSDTAYIGPVILTNEWKEYSIDLKGRDLSFISGGFAWVANVDGNPYHCTFYLDDIRFE
jgi:hypothetical protein